MYRHSLLFVQKTTSKLRVLTALALPISFGASVSFTAPLYNFSASAVAQWQHSKHIEHAGWAEPVI
jgi:hypothetical protein